MEEVYIFNFHINIKLSWQYLLNFLLTSLKYSLKFTALIEQKEASFTMYSFKKPNL